MLGYVHELLAVCAADEKYSYHFVLDRGNVGLFNTRVQIVYSGRVTNKPNKNGCDYSDPHWNRFVFNKDPENTTILREATNFPSAKQHTFNILPGQQSFVNLLTIAKNYVRDFQNYTLTKHCQHFATGVFNKLTGGLRKMSDFDHIPNIDNPEKDRQALNEKKQEKQEKQEKQAKEKA